MARAYFDIRGDQLGSRVTWGFDTNVTEGQGWLGGILGRYFGLFLDNWVGADYEKGLRSLALYAETLPSRDFSSAMIDVINVEPVDILYLEGTVQGNADSLADALATGWDEVIAFMGHSGIEVAGQPMAITWQEGDNGWGYRAAIPVAELSAPVVAPLMVGQSPGGPSVRIIHSGSYENTLTSYEQLAAYMAVKGLERGALSWEHYISNPSQTAPDARETHIYMQLSDAPAN